MRQTVASYLLSNLLQSPMTSITHDCSSKTLYLFVHISDGPDMVILRPNVTTHTIDEFAALGDIICDAYCYPACTYVWTKQGYSSQLSSSVLPFGRRVTRNNAGVYTCIATNPGSNRHGSVLLTMHVRCKLMINYFKKIDITLSLT